MFDDPLNVTMTAPTGFTGGVKLTGGSIMSVWHAMKRRGLSVLLSAVLLMSGLLAVLAPPASATVYCNTVEQTWYLSDGSISIRVATIHTWLTACTDNTSVTSTSETTSISWTSPGVAAGWGGSYGPTVLTSSNSSIGSWYTARGNLQICATHWTRVMCSKSENFYVNSSVVMDSIVLVKPGPGQTLVGRRVFNFSFTPHDSNSVVHFNTTI